MNMNGLPEIITVGRPIRPLNTCLEPARNLPTAASGLPATGLEPGEDLPAMPRTLPGEARKLPVICQNLPAASGAGPLPWFWAGDRVYGD